MFFYIYDVFVAAKPENLEIIKDNIKLKFNIQEYGKVNNFLGVYCECGRDVKVFTKN